MSVTAVDFLTDARDRISDPARWTQHAWARDAFGEEAVSYQDGGNADTQPVCWCSYGTMAQSDDDLSLKTGDDQSLIFFAAEDFLKEAATELYGEHLFGYITSNDLPTRTHEEVIATFNLAIKKAVEHGLHNNADGYVG